MSKSTLADIYLQHHRGTDAEELQIQILKAREKILGDGHPETLNSKYSLAKTYSQQNRWLEAEELSREGGAY